MLEHIYRKPFLGVFSLRINALLVKKIDKVESNCSVMQEDGKEEEETTKKERKNQNEKDFFLYLTGIVINPHEQKYGFINAKQINELLQE